MTGVTTLCFPSVRVSEVLTTKFRSLLEDIPIFVMDQEPTPSWTGSIIYASFNFSVIELALVGLWCLVKSIWLVDFLYSSGLLFIARPNSPNPEKIF